MLALEYLALCLNSSNERYFSRILAITFTNKAAHELKERIIAFLADLASETPDPVKVKELIRMTSLSRVDIQKRATMVHEAILHNYGEIHVSTIDSFVLSILRAFSKELGMAFDFDVELDGARVKDLLVESIMNQIGKDQFITRQLALLVTQNLDDGRSWDPKRDMKESIDHLMDEGSIAYREELASMGEDKLQTQLIQLTAKRNGLWKAILEAQENVRAGMVERGFEKGDFLGGQRGFISFAFKNLRLDTPPSATQAKNIEEGKFSSPAARKSGIGDNVDAFGQTIIAPNFRSVMEFLTEFTLVDNFYRNRLSLVLALRLQNLLKRFEDEEGSSIIRDNNFKIARLIEDNPTPFIYERVGERFQHFLIDEFQDTSILQWRNMLPLIDGSLSYGNKNFLVGDVKQSIYRWRGGEADQMVNLPNIPGSENSRLLRQIEENLDRNIERKELKENYRSSKAVIQFNNDLFKFLSSSLPERYQKSYADVKQGEQRSLLGYVELRAIEKGASNEDVLDSMMQSIADSEVDGYRGSDICILTRSNKDGRDIAKHLESIGYGVSSPDSLLLSGNADVQLLMSFIDLLSSQDPVGAELYITYRLLERVGREAEYHTWSDRTKNYRNTIIRLQELTVSLGLIWSAEHYQDSNAYQCLDVLCKELQIDSYDAYVQELMNTALGYIQNQDSTLIGFFEFWKNKEGSLAVKAGIDRDSIQLMTIHKSKGLQFPVVIIPNLKWSSGRISKKKEWVSPQNGILDIGLLSINKSLSNTVYAEIYEEEKDKSLVDDINVLYVASTRAEDRMYMHVMDTGKQGVSASLLSFMKNRSKGEECYRLGEAVLRIEGENSDEPSKQLRTYDRQERGDILSMALGKSDHIARKRLMGQILHQVLEKSSDPAEANKLLELLMPSTDYPVEDKLSVQTSIERIYKIEEEQGWHDPSLRRRKEIEVLASDGNIYRMDKILIDDPTKKVTVIDYKTGKEDEKDREQMEGYLQILREMEWDTVEGYLLYTSTGKVERV